MMHIGHQCACAGVCVLVSLKQLRFLDSPGWAKQQSSPLAHPPFSWSRHTSTTGLLTMGTDEGGGEGKGG